MNILSTDDLKVEEPICEDEDKFKESFKYFKSKKCAPDFSGVIDFHCQDNLKFPIETLPAHSLPPELECTRKELVIKPPNEWGIFSLHHHPGLFVICNAFSESGAMLWIRRCVEQFSGLPHKSNLSGRRPRTPTWWAEVKESLARDKREKLVDQLRWSTMGYHHNWDTKEYCEADWSAMPGGLEDLCRIFLWGLGHPAAPRYMAQAAIVNYYPPGSTLSPHTDHSEAYKEAPLLSLSFGQTGLFLIGGRDKTSAPSPLFLRHGDVMIMTEDSRLCYHAVPRIMTEATGGGLGQRDAPRESSFSKFLTVFRSIISILKDVDQRRESNSGAADIMGLLREESGGVSSDVREVLECCGGFVDGRTGEKEPKFCFNYEDLESIINYIKTVRINMNVRQVKPSSVS